MPINFNLESNSSPQAIVLKELEYLYQDIQNGLFGEAAKQGQFAAYVSALKQQVTAS
jgi:hypothetical protein